MTRIFSVTRVFTFDASHVLPLHDGRCARLHGHTYRLEVTVTGPLNDNGIVIDFADIKNAVRESALTTLDHSHLNDTIDNPTAENVAGWILDAVTRAGIDAARVRLWETPDCYAEVSP